ncbi:4Fe-4S dicluster domain-containing protein [Pseudomonas syringae]|uniref:4Fe-4S dicluster domain-containing protein n=1 Tax=Pseudomonas syringae TaxID=317 RepID=A0A9Q3X506_PSESX|nr:4Fe-4S dicluster domain-containing protein [Pseudomonas syringae]MCF5065341.1 4Fe-4S dicluster domain-containing protein [Pseudomonas syringae]MCF5120509.1 4Fe-4S dicluster domain-containing protein [Pseudomonas syringae]MCF5380542.1 4Fe-4S dicluster domain-containing protein [Pseudomonas syringae]
MLELIYSDLCNGCGQCVAVCPTNVLALDAQGTLRIAEQQACQTCFMCELYCSRDALYVDPDVEQLRHPDPLAVRAAGLLGQYRRDSGWDEWAHDPRHRNEHWRMDGIFALARSNPPNAISE